MNGTAKVSTPAIVVARIGRSRGTSYPGQADPPFVLLNLFELALDIGTAVASKVHYLYFERPAMREHWSSRHHPPSSRGARGHMPGVDLCGWP